MTDKELAALRRESDELEGEKVKLDEKRKMLKQLAENHRDDLPALRKDSAEQDQIAERQSEIDKRLDEIRAEFEKNAPKNNQNNQGEIQRIMEAHNKYRTLAEGMNKREVVETVEYRSAFLKHWQGRDAELNDAEKRAMTTVNNSAVMPLITLDLIMGKLTAENTLTSLVTVLNIPNLLKIPKEDVVNDAAWVGEGADGAIKDDTTKFIQLTAFKLMRFIRVTMEAKALSINAFESWIVDRMAKKMRIAIEKAVASGSGTGQPTGFTTGITYTDGTNQITPAADLTYDDFVNLEGLIGEEYFSEAVYVMNRQNLSKVRKLKDDVKRPLFEREVEDGFAGNIGGIPVKLSRYVTDGIYLGSFKDGYVLNFISNVEFATSDEAGFMSGDTVYRAMALLDGKPSGIDGTIARINLA